MAKNDGKQAEAGWLSIIERRGGVIERFRDAADLRGRNGGKAVGSFPQPSDFLVTLDGLLQYAEVKSTVKGTSFAFGSIQPAQSSAALRQAKVGGPYYFYIFSFDTCKWYVMTCKQYAEILASGRRSVKFEELPLWSLASP